MNSHVRRWFLALLFAWGLGLSINAALPGPDDAWTRSLARQKIAITARLSSPRIMVVGGSGVFYSVDAELIERRTGVTTINQGMHAGLGTDVIIGLFSDQWQRGDLVVLALEYGMVDEVTVQRAMGSRLALGLGRPTAGVLFAREAAERASQMGSPGLTDVLRGVGSFLLRGRVSQFRLGGYGSAVGPRGDAAEMPPHLDAIRSLDLQDPSEASLEHIRGVVERARARGVRVAFSLPWVFFDHSRAEAQRRQARRVAGMLQTIAPVMFDSVTANVLDDPGLFSDSQYHPSAQGRAIRSNQLTDQLCAAGLLSCRP